MKFRLNLEELDGRIVPSGNPGDPPDNTPPANPGSPNPGDDFTDTQLMSLLAAAATSGDYSAVQQYLTDTYGPGASSDNSDDPDAGEQPTVTPPPIPTPQPPFSPIPPIASVPAPPMRPTDYSTNGGRAGTPEEIAEVKNLDRQIAAIDIAKTAIAKEQLDLAKQRVGLATAARVLTTAVADAKTAVTAAEAAVQQFNSQENRERLASAQGALAGTKAALASVNAIQANIGTRIDYLKAKVAELDTLRATLVARREAIISAWTSNGTVAANPGYTLPTFIDWNSAEWTDYTKPVPVPKANTAGR